MHDWPTLLFFLLSFSPGPFWLMLLFAPRRPRLMAFFDGYLVLLSLVFCALTLPDLPAIMALVVKPTLQGVGGLLSSTHGTLGAWNHMILGDLWIGRWVAHDAVDKGVNPWLRAPFILTIMFIGPVGLAAYLAYRMFVLKRFALTDASSS